jgi:uncharacterized membrane protein
MGKKKKTRNAKTESTAADKSAAKRAAVLGTDNKSRFPLMVVFMGLIAASIIGSYMLLNRSPRGTVAAGPVAGGAETFSYSAALFEDGQARHYEYRNGKYNIRYFVLKSSDGVIRAAFDACDVCWPAGKGYYQDGDVMVCRNCGRRFASVLVNEVKGGCNPAPLNRRMENGKVVISIEDLIEGRQYFDFSGKA